METASLEVSTQVYSPVVEAEAILEQAAPTPETEDARQASRFRNFGKAALTRVGLEVVGTGVDLALMGAGSAGVDIIKDVANREVAAAGVDNMLLNKIQGAPETGPEPIEKSRIRRVGGRVLNLAMGIGAAVAAQKYGPELVEHVASSLNDGTGETLVPLASKVGAITGMTSLQRRVGL